MIDTKKIEQATTMLLEGLGVDLTDHNFAKTPQRVARVYAELFAPPDVEIPVFDENFTDMVVMRRHEFYTLCPHHMLPVKITASVAYLPNGKVIGASKLMRMMHDVNRGPMTQEALTAAIVQRVRDLTEAHSRGEAAILRGEHGCFRIRGVRSHCADMVTSRFSGEFRQQPELQTQFFRMVGELR